MNFTLEQIRDAYKKLPNKVQFLITDADTTELITNSLEELQLSTDQRDLADSEILYAMYGLQTLDAAIENIAKLTGKQVGELVELKKNLYENIFSKLSQEVKSAAEPVTTPPETKGDVMKKLRADETKEQAVERLRQKMIGQKPEVSENSAKPETPKIPEIPDQNLPMIEPNEKVHDVPHVEEKKPEPLIQKVAPQPQAPKPPTTPYYPKGNDPYREPLN